MNIAAIDVGLKRIGLALGANQNMIIPQNPILRKNRDQAARDVDRFLLDWEITTLVVGLPRSNEQIHRRIYHFIGLLSYSQKVVYVDEDMTSIEAEDLTKGIFAHKKDGKVDSVAAMLILSRYFGMS